MCKRLDTGLHRYDDVFSYKSIIKSEASLRDDQDRYDMAKGRELICNDSSIKE